MTGLKKEMSLYGLTMVSIGSCIGSGIFLTPSLIAGHLPSPLLILMVWALGGVVALTGALTFAELGSRFPGAGGIYVYLKEAYNDFVAFLFGWSYFLVVNTGAIAALCIAFAYYLAFIIPLGENGKIIVAVSAIIVVTVINILGVKQGEIFTNVFTGLKLIGITAVILIGLLLGSYGLNDFQPSSVSVPDEFGSAIGLALIGVIFSFGGFQHASFLAGEARDPRRTVPLAMIIGVTIVCLVYLLTNLAYLYLLPVADIISAESIAANAITTVIPVGGVLIALLIAISTFGTVGIFTLSAPRIYFAMAKDGIFFKKLAEIHPKFKTPVYAILFQSAWAIVLLLFWGTFVDLITYVLFTDWIFLTLTAISIFIFRRSDGKQIRADVKNQNRPYKMFGYPLTPIIFIVISIFLIVNTLIEKPTQAWAGLGLLALGLPVFYYFKRKRIK